MTGPLFATSPEDVDQARGVGTIDRAVTPGPVVDADRPPHCPVCNKRLVILTSSSYRDAAGAYVRRQLWGCPRGHATATYQGGTFGPMELLPTYEDVAD